MIDILIDVEGGLTVAHDDHSLPRLKKLCLNRHTGELAYVGEAGEHGIIGGLSPVMVAALSPNAAPTIIRLVGFTPENPYNCELSVS